MEARVDDRDGIAACTLPAAAAAPNLDQPNVATDFAKPAKEAEGTGIPSKLTLNFYLPHAIEFDAAEVRRGAGITTPYASWLSSLWGRAQPANDYL